jgi:hypothetical protein
LQQECNNFEAWFQGEHPGHGFGSALERTQEIKHDKIGTQFFHQPKGNPKKIKEITYGN